MMTRLPGQMTGACQPFERDLSAVRQDV